MERWHLLVTEKFLFWAFPWWKMRSFLRQKVKGKMIFTDHWKVPVSGYRKILVCSFSGMENMVFFSQKVDVKVIFTWFFLSFPWYSRTLEIWFFLQFSLQFLVFKTFGFLLSVFMIKSVINRLKYSINLIKFFNFFFLSFFHFVIFSLRIIY